LNLDNTPVTSIEPLRGMPLRRLSLLGTKVQDLSPLIGAKLGVLVLNKARIDTASLAKISVKDLNTGGVLDLAPLTGWTVESIGLYNDTEVLSPEILRTMPNLTAFTFNELNTNPENHPELAKVLLSMPQLETINRKPAAEAREELLKSLQKTE
jgi:hypothetical protein